MHAGSSGAGGRIDLEVAVDAFVRTKRLAVSFPQDNWSADPESSRQTAAGVIEASSRSRSR
jgi:hypothetical protein